MPRSLTWLLAGCVGLVCWTVLLLRAVSDSGPSGYFFQLAQTPAYFLAWLSLLFGLQAVVTSAQAHDASRLFEVRMGICLGLLPETLLTIPVVARVEVGAGSWFPLLDRVVYYLQLPGRTATTPFGTFERWAVGLTDPGAAWVAKEIAILNLANVCGWVAICLLASALARRLGLPGESPTQNKRIERAE